jgi:hypothetical protein
MTQTQVTHTLGPWSRYNDGPASHIFVESTKGGSVCKIANNSHAEANANLIAAAPDLLEALEITQRTCVGNFADGYTMRVTGHEMNAILAAIRCAKGDL